MLICNKSKIKKCYLEHNNGRSIEIPITDKELINQMDIMSLDEQEVHEQQKELSYSGKKSVDLLELLSKLAKKEIISSREESE